MTPIDSVHSGSPLAPRGEDPLVVRRHERLNCRLPATVRVRDDSAVPVSLSRTVGDGAGCVPVTVVDCSEGGAGIECGCFLPRATTVVLRVPMSGIDGTLECVGTIQRVMMISRSPTYYLGVSFAGEGAATDSAAVERLLGACRKQAAGPEGNDARP